jgi:hypothetical protein
VNAGGTAQFTATVTGATNTAVDWTATGGSITQTGLYTAGSSAGTFTVTATSVEDPTVSASATVTIAASPCYVGHWTVTVTSRSPNISPTAVLPGEFTISTTGPALDLTGYPLVWFWSSPQNDNPMKGPYVGSDLGGLRHVNFNGEFPGAAISAALSADCNHITGTWSTPWFAFSPTAWFTFHGDTRVAPGRRKGLHDGPAEARSDR